MKKNTKCLDFFPLKYKLLSSLNKVTYQHTLATSGLDKRILHRSLALGTSAAFAVHQSRSPSSWDRAVLRRCWQNRRARKKPQPILLFLHSTQQLLDCRQSQAQSWLSSLFFPSPTQCMPGTSQALLYQRAMRTRGMAEGKVQVVD